MAPVAQRIEHMTTDYKFDPDITPYQTTAIAIELTDSATIASHALFGKTCFFAFK